MIPFTIALAEAVGRPFETRFTGADGFTLTGSASVAGGELIVPSTPSRADRNMADRFSSMVGRQIVFDIMADNSGGGLAIAELYFGCNSAGGGTIARIDCRGAQPCGFWNSGSWNSNTGNAATSSSVSLAAVTWHAVRIHVGSIDVCQLWVNGALLVTSGTRLFGGVYIGNQPSFCQVKYRNLLIT